MKIKFLILFLLLNTCICYSQNPWLQGKGDVLLSPSVTHYYTDTNSDNSSNKSDFSNNGFYENYVYKLYFSTSLISNKLSLIGNIPYIKSTYGDDSTLDNNNELGDVELGVKMHLKKIGEYHYLMGSLTTIIPMYSNDVGPFVGFDKFGTELKVNISGNSKWMGINDNFHQLEFGIKKFFDGGPYQFKLYGSQAYRLTDKFLVMGDVEVLLSRGDDFTVSQENIRITPDFDILKTTLNFGYEFSPNFALYAGGFSDLWNRNISVGKGWQIFSVIKL
ncbi:hypothetical protein H0I29_13290 [Polaribacter sp. R2A056_3_33]|uniref:hypothetical protein n=1 Tax=unclassified Polaribacter TaxID=196858 RepID=UPI001C4E3FE1|nr:MULTISPECIES: hypothetical protein [unclassified Polaribacter]QXP64940.1 hypothetical protein H0I27_07130 [Polaribacter sp. HaHaR_3_91]QXP69588.1 hypothetical protein H0I29_13290 [Polaribacter sp. R2A056_3_33]